MMYLNKGMRTHKHHVTSAIGARNKEHVGQLNTAISGIVRTTRDKETYKDAGKVETEKKRYTAL